tara:strand:+ start:544 stop:768 length:225 start_codon:yes stop_codon:yes gene_type:complete
MAAQRHRKKTAKPKKGRTRRLKLKEAWKARKKRAPRMKAGGELKGQFKGKRPAPKGYHYMPDGKLMKDSDMEYK